VSEPNEVMTEVEAALIRCFSDVWQTFKATATELVAQRHATDGLLKQYEQLAGCQEMALDRDVLLTAARESSAPREIAGQNYPLVLETYVRTIPRTGSGLAVRKALGLLEHLD
jgi:hypothetical protein